MGMATESQFHVLAVDDSLIDRKLIEKLLKISSFQGTFLVAKHRKEILNISVQTLYSWVVVVSFVYVILSCISTICYILCFFSMAVTTVDSGTKALEFLGLHEHDQSKPSTLTISPNNHQVYFIKSTLSVFEIPYLSC